MFRRGTHDPPQVRDQSPHVLMARVAARLSLVEIDLDDACDGLIDMDWTFWRACDDCDRAAHGRSFIAI
jgi:hypothetical protein